MDSPYRQRNLGQGIFLPGRPDQPEPHQFAPEIVRQNGCTNRYGIDIKGGHPRNNPVFLDEPFGPLDDLLVERWVFPGRILGCEPTTRYPLNGFLQRIPDGPIHRSGEISTGNRGASLRFNDLGLCTLLAGRNDGEADHNREETKNERR
jgi:hypothetical protein